jgi:glutathione S-transferase
MIIVHHLNNSRSQRVLWLLEELNLPYEIRHYQRDAKTMLAPPSLRAVHPLGKSPVITDGNKVIAESGAIMEYLVDTYGKGRLKPLGGTPEYLRYIYWMHYAEGSIMPLLVMMLIFSLMPKQVPALVRPIAKLIAKGVNDRFLAPNFSTHMNFIEGELGKTAWFAGNEFTAADIQMSFAMEAAMIRGGDGVSRPKVSEYLERIRARPGYKKAIEKGGPLEVMS